MTYIWLTVRPNCEESNDTGTDETQHDESSNNEIIPSGSLHGLVGEPWLLILSNKPIALEGVLQAQASRRLCVEGGYGRSLTPKETGRR